MPFQNEHSWDLLVEVLALKLSAREAWNRFIDLQAKAVPQPYWKAMREIDIVAEAETLQIWIEEQVEKEPVPENVVALSIDISSFVEEGKTLSAIYVFGYDTYNSEDTSWAVDPVYTPDGCVPQVLALLEEITRTDEENSEFLNWIMPLALCAVIFDDIFRSRLDIRLVSQDRNEIFAIVGHTTGDYINISSIKNDKLMFTDRQVSDLLYDYCISEQLSFSEYIGELNAIGVIRFDSFVADGHFEHYSRDGEKVVSKPFHVTYTIAPQCDNEAVLKYLKLFKQGRKDYYRLAKGLARSGIEKVSYDTENYAVTYFDKDGNGYLLPSGQEEVLLSAVYATDDSPMRFTDYFKLKDGYLVTPLIVVLFVIIYVLMMANGINYINPTLQTLYNFGGNYGIEPGRNDWWRLFTSLFLHAGILHLIVDTYMLMTVGILLERLMGSLRFLIAFTTTGALASIAGAYFFPRMISVGASGAVFGLYGIYLYLLCTRLIDRKPNIAMLISMVIYIGFSMFNQTKGGFANAAHIVGFLSGAGTAYLFYRTYNKKILYWVFASVFLLKLLQVINAYIG